MEEEKKETEGKKETEEKKETETKKNLSDSDFYAQACSYFYYHAEQRTTMINYFVAIFAACLALYGTLLSDYAWVSALVAAFMTIVSVVFYFIDLRNRFDVKESQNVIEQIERDYKMDQVHEHYAYGVFSNEANIYKCYGCTPRKGSYNDLRRAYKKRKCSDQALTAFNTAKAEFLEAHKGVSEYELMKSLDSQTLISLSFCIKVLYFICMVISASSVALAIILALI